jgi:tetratricopeptide (TPR) repeat protein
MASGKAPKAAWLALLALGACRSPERECDRTTEARDFALAVSFCEQAFSRTQDAHFAVSAALAHLQLGHPRDALEKASVVQAGPHLGSALRVSGIAHEQLGDRSLARRELRQALTLHLDAKVAPEAARDAHALTGSFWRAGQYLEALAPLSQLFEQARAAKEPRLEGFAWMALGDVLFEIGDAGASERALGEAARLLSSQSPGDWAYVRMKQGALHEEARRFALAQDAYGHARALADKAHRPEVARSAQLGLGMAALGRNELQDAAAGFDRAEALLGGTEDPPLRTALLHGRGMLALALGHPDEARKLLSEAQSRTPIPERAWKISVGLGAAFEALGDETAAVASYSQAIETIERLRRELGSPELRTWLLSAKRAPYEALFELHARAGRTAQALEVVMALQARAFGDAIIESTAHSLEQGPSFEASPGETARLRQESLTQLLPRLTFGGWAEVPRADVLLRSLPSSQSVWTYFEARGRVYWLAVDAGRVRIRVLPLGADALSALAARFRGHLDDSDIAAELGAQVLPDPLPKPGARVQIVAGGILKGVPFAALRTPHGSLAEQLELTYVPSLAAAAHRFQGDSTFEEPALVLGDPLGNLPFAAQEVKTVASQLGVEVHLGANATKALLQSAKHPGVLHVASHAGLSPEGAWLELADGRVGASELLGWRLRPRLVVLASCQSAAARDDDLWGSLSSVFLASGARAVLGTLAPVNDAITSQFLTELYDAGLARAPARALVTVQRHWAKSRPASHWAPFVLFQAANAIPLEARR